MRLYNEIQNMPEPKKLKKMSVYQDTLYSRIASDISGQYIRYNKELVEKFKSHFDQEYLFLFDMMETVLDKTDFEKALKLLNTAIEEHPERLQSTLFCDKFLNSISGTSGPISEY